MYKVSVPIMSIDCVPDLDEKLLIKQLKKFNAERVFVAFHDINDVKENTRKIKKLKRLFDEHGIETALWCGCLAFQRPESGFENVVDLQNQKYKVVCPLDKRFVEIYCQKWMNYLDLGINTIMFDDDFRINSVWTEAKCFCELHMKEYMKLLGEDVSPEEFKANVLNGLPNKFREVWLKVNGDALRNLALNIRRTFDKYKPGIRIALASGPALWGVDGVFGWELAKILAGKDNKPLLRLSGGPYWIEPFNKPLAPIFDFTRREAFMCRDKGIELMAEGDVYPRPRYAVPSSMLECFDTIMRADGNFDGILKYGLDYYSSLNYETGYADKADKNKEFYELIDKYFNNKKTTGINPFEPLNIYKFKKVNKIAGACFDTEKNLVDSASIQFLNDNSIPVTFEDDTLHVIFGENAEAFDVKLLKYGAVLDIPAALILQKKGIDTGIISVNDLEYNDKDTGKVLFDIFFEEYLEDNIMVETHATEIYDVVVEEKAEILSQIITMSKKRYNGAYRYENKDGYRFLVLPFDANISKDVRWVFKSYSRQRQIINSYKWITGSKLDAICSGNPYLYILTKKSKNALAVGLWNLSLDSIDVPVVELHKPYNEIEFINCTGKIEGDKVILSKLYAWEFCGFNVIS